MTRPERVTEHTQHTTADKTASVAFWALVLGYPLFMAMWRWLHR